MDSLLPLSTPRSINQVEMFLLEDLGVIDLKDFATVLAHRHAAPGSGRPS